MPQKEKITVELCMGSSCFARGNSHILTEIEAYLENNDLGDKVELVGHLCVNNCNNGPNITIDGVQYSGLSVDEVLSHIKAALEG